MIIEEEPIVKTVEELRTKFYLDHCEEIRGRRCACAPNALVLNPFFKGLFDINKYYAIYTRGFYIVIEQNENSPLGPHAVKLFLQTLKPLPPQQGQIHWLSSAQIECHFFSVKQIRQQLHSVIRRRQFFATIRHLNSRITINPTAICLQTL